MTKVSLAVTCTPTLALPAGTLVRLPSHTHPPDSQVLELQFENRDRQGADGEE